MRCPAASKAAPPLIPPRCGRPQQSPDSEGRGCRAVADIGPSPGQRCRLAPGHKRAALKGDLSGFETDKADGLSNGRHARGHSRQVELQEGSRRPGGRCRTDQGDQGQIADIDPSEAVGPPKLHLSAWKLTANNCPPASAKKPRSRISSIT